MSSSGAQARAVAAEVVDAVVYAGQSLDAAIAAREGLISEDDRSLLRMLCYGTLRHYWRLDNWLHSLLSKPLRKRDRVVQALLLVGLYQVAHMRIPDHAVVSETVAAARHLKRPKLSGLVNACLRRYLRETDGVRSASDPQSEWNHPSWIIDALKSDWPNDWQTILTANNERAPMWLRVNASRASAAEYARRLQDASIDSALVDGVADAVRLLNPTPVKDLPGFEAGDVSVQDAAAQIAARWLLSESKSRVLDACAAPGGKSGHMLEIGGDDLSLTAVDNDPSRIFGIEENLARIGRNATIIAADASKPEQWWDGQKFDGILLDAPCSASGVIRRHPDIKLLRRQSDLPRLAQLQGSLLRALWQTLSPGGTLLYVTCSVFTVENDAVVGNFVASQADALEKSLLPNNNIRDLMHRKACGYQILPGTNGMDGFYYAALQKQKVS